MTTNPPNLAATGQPSSGVSGSKDVARRASFQSPDPHPTTHRPPEQALFGLHIIAPPQWSAVTRATAICRCGTYDKEARGRAAVQQLVEDWEHHRTTCRLRHPATRETRKAS
ncbi:hypothetical protein [Streptomyces sp. WZ-12]|uniref:hypothetical protein n=1 Tax=Streptomyces sp. WZ-12 TaxID=3030210 RepID=UPI0023812E18|nr:hypothetical protein [Streptomyces sp. WZ-12]